MNHGAFGIIDAIGMIIGLVPRVVDVIADAPLRAQVFMSLVGTGVLTVWFGRLAVDAVMVGQVALRHPITLARRYWRAR